VTVALAEPEVAVDTAAIPFTPRLWWDFATTSDAKALAKAKTPEKQAKAAGLDWAVEEMDVFTKIGLEGVERYIQVPGKKAIVRTDTGIPLSIMGGRYSILQNIRLFEFGDALVDSGLTVIGAGEFAGGKVVWVQFALPEEIVVNGDPSAVKPYLLLYTSHDGSRPFGALLTFVRVFCRNTFNSAIAGAADKYIIRHTPGAAGRVDEARRVLGLSFNASKTFEKIAGSLAKKPMTLADFREFTEVLIPSPTREGPADTRTVRQRQSDETRDLLAELFDHSPLLDGVPNNYWRAFNAVTEWADHHRDYRASKENAVDDNKALSLMDGQASDLKGRALALLSKN
jgi:phage/plasmid-like protein (TIGR03299 family)